MKKSSKLPIYIFGYPRSGNVYLARLLGDALHSRVQADPEKKVTPAIGDEGNRRRGKFVIRQHHSWKPYEEEAPIIYLYRDPRDVAVSIMLYWGIENLDTLFSHSTKPPKPLHPTYGWASMMNSWMGTQGKTYRDYISVCTNYERLLRFPLLELKRIISVVVFPNEAPDDKRLKQTLRRQSFSTRRTEIATAHPSKYPYGQTVQLKHMRKGIIGDWRNYFRRRHAKVAHDAWWDWLHTLGYETDENWWKEIEK